MFEIIGLIAPLFGLIVIGYICGKIAKIPVEGLAWFNFFIIYVALPAMFFKLLSQTSFESISNGEISGARFVVLSSLSTLLIFLAVFIGSYAFVKIRRGEFDVGVATIHGFAGAYGNIGYMGPPLAILAFGPLAIAPAALIFSFDNAMHFILAPLFMAFRDQGKTDAQPKIWALIPQVLWKILTHPFILATIAGFSAAAIGFTLSGPAGKLLDFLAGAAAPSALFVMGVTAAIRPVKRLPIELSLLVPIKLLVHPVLIYFILTGFGNFPQMYVQTAVLLAALPAAANVFVIAQQYNVWQERASSAVIVTTVISIFTLPLVLYVLKNGDLF